MRHFYLFLLSLSFIMPALAQRAVKYNAVVARNLASSNKQDYLLSVLVRGDIASIKRITEEAGGRFKFFAGNIASIQIPVKNISMLISSPLVERIEAKDSRIQVMNDTMRVRNNVEEVQMGATPLPQGYDGSGVVMGIIDTGIDFTHPDFRDSVAGESVTRIKYLWDQNLTTGGTTPQPYNYGQEWNNSEIDSGQSTHPFSNHGTFVAGVAAGNGKGANINKGAAPKADIVFVALNLNNPDGECISDAVNYIFTKAQELGKPCVINASVGDYYGSHDGLDLEAQVIKNLLTQQSGRAMAAAAGNAGSIPFHLAYDVTSDTSFTWFKPSGGYVYMQIWADTADFKNVEFAIGADRTTPNFFFKGNTAFSNISSDLGVLVTDTLKNGSQRIGIIQTFGNLDLGRYYLEVYIVPDSTSFNWRLMTTGSGKFDCWSFNLVASGIPSQSVFPDSIYYKYPDLNQTMVSGFQCLDEVITVANYVNKNSHLNCAGNIYTDNSVIHGPLSGSSSRGPTRDGRIKPDIAATGGYTNSCGIVTWMAGIAADSTLCATAVSYGNLHFKDGGTSAASPVVAGIAALYLQRYPTATCMDVKNAIVHCAKQDAFTGSSLPNSSWGYGKANAFMTLLNCTIPPIVSLSSLPSTCVNSSSFLISGGAPSGGTYSGNGVVNDSIFDPAIANAGTHVITYSYTDPYTLLSDSATQSITVYPLPTVNLGNDTSICDGSSYQLDAGNAGGSYLWSDSSTTQTIMASAADTLYVTVTDVNSCVNSDTLIITVDTLPVVTLSLSTTFICIDNPPITLAGGSPTGGAYSGTGVSSGMFDPSAAGAGTHLITYMYTDSITLCSDSVIQSIEVGCIGISKNNSDQALFSVYPNPAHTSVNILISSSVQNLTMQIIDIRGRVVYHQYLDKAADGTIKKIDVSSLANGIYYMQINTPEISFIEKININH